MANEVSHRHSATGETLYFTIRNTSRQMWNTAGTPNFETLTVANWTDYDTALSESPASSYFYVGTFPAVSGNMVVGWYWVDIFKRAGGSPAISDTLYASYFGYWDGTTFKWWGNDLIHILGSLVSTSSAQLGVNVVNFGGAAGTFASGRPEVNTSHIAGSAVSTTSAQIGVNVVQISTDATAADNAEAFFDGTGYAGTNNVIPLVTTVTNLTNAATNGDLTATMKASVNTEADTALSDYGALKPTTAGRTLDVSATGEAGVDWANVGSPTTAVGLTGTTIATSQVVASVSGAVGSVTGAVGSVTGNVGGNVTGSVGSVVGAVGSVTGNVGGNVTGSVGSLATQAKADVNAEVLDVLNVDTFAEPAQGTPGATITLAAKIGYLYKFLRNRKTQTATTKSIYNDDATTVDHKCTVADDGTTYSETEITTGP